MRIFAQNFQLWVQCAKCSRHPKGLKFFCKCFYTNSHIFQSAAKIFKKKTFFRYTLLPIPFTELYSFIILVQLKFRGFAIPRIVLIRFFTDNKTSWLRNTEMHLRWAATFDLRQIETIRSILRFCHEEGLQYMMLL